MNVCHALDSKGFKKEKGHSILNKNYFKWRKQSTPLINEEKLMNEMKFVILRINESFKNLIGSVPGRVQELHKVKG